MTVIGVYTTGRECWKFNGSGNIGFLNVIEFYRICTVLLQRFTILKEVLDINVAILGISAIKAEGDCVRVLRNLVYTI